MKIFEVIKSKIKAFSEKGLVFATWFGISNPFGSDAFTTTGGTIQKVQFVINVAINASALVAVVVMIYGGYLMIVAAGDSDQIQKGEQTITSGIIGLIIVFIAKLIIQFVIDRLF